tara:strand:- start:657 stop:1355 length:699 start_codon:yes stop_codon:yes gene_type:complete
MDIFYSDMIDDNNIELSSLESHHCSIVLRKGIGDQIEILDGIGNQYICKIIDNNKKKVIANILDKNFYNNQEYNIHLIIAPTKSQDRIEWLVEKSIEIGVSEISFIKTNRTVRKKVNIDRINKIAISAMKQSSQFYLPHINNLNSFKNVVSNLSEKQLFIAHLEDQERKKISDIYQKNNNCCIMIGPEGDFTIDEIDLAKKNNFKSVTLGNSRLRTETAGIYAVSMVKALNE